MRLSMVCPRMMGGGGGGGNPREFDFINLSLGGDFESILSPVGGKLYRLYSKLTLN